MKFGRRCQLSVEINPSPTPGTDFSEGKNTLTIPQDITIEFEIDRQSLSSSQTATFRIYKLSEQTRNLLYRDPWELTYRAIKFRAGYADDISLPLCFNGFVSSATSQKPEGGDFVTEIKAYDGGLSMQNGYTAISIVSGQKTSDILQALSSNLPGVRASPIIGTFPSTNLRGKVIMNNTWQAIVEESNGLAVIDNGQVKILNYNEGIAPAIPIIDAAAGLLGSPRRGATKIEFDMLFEPRLALGQIVQLQSAANPLFNRFYKVVGFSHEGIISPSVDGPCGSNVSLFFGADELTAAQKASGRQTMGPFQIVEGTVVQ